MYNNIRNFLAMKKPQYRTEMLNYYKCLEDKVKENGEEVDGRWLVSDKVELSSNHYKDGFSKTVMLSSIVDDNPSTTDVVSIKERLKSSTIDSITFTTFTKKEEKRLMGLLGKREVIIEKEESIIYSDNKRYHQVKKVKIDAGTGRELKDVTQYPDGEFLSYYMS